MYNMSLLKSIDKQVLKTIATKQLTVSEIARKTGFGRTTLNYRLKLLLKEKLISRSKIVGRRVFYSVNKKAVNEARESRLIEVFNGSNIVQAYKYFFEVPKNTFVYGVQGFDAIRKIIKTLPVDFLKNAHKKQKNRSVILKGFINKRALSILEDVSLEINQSHSGRTVGVKLVEGNVFMGPCEILCSQTTFLINDTAKKRALVLREKAITIFLYEIFSVFYDNSENVQVFKMNDYWDSLINKK